MWTHAYTSVCVCVCKCIPLKDQIVILGERVIENKLNAENIQHKKSAIGTYIYCMYVQFRKEGKRN